MRWKVRQLAFLHMSMTDATAVTGYVENVVMARCLRHVRLRCYHFYHFYAHESKHIPGLQTGCNAFVVSRSSVSISFKEDVSLMGREGNTMCKCIVVIRNNM